MVLELYVWAPAFSLPSIDPQCLAAIAYFRQAVPQGAWVLRSAYHPSSNPTGQLPALRDGSTWSGGFRTIVTRLRQISEGGWDLDRSLTDDERAEITAFSAFVDSSGQPLLDLYLYVSTQNYSGITRPAYSKFSPWPLQYSIPPTLQTTAKLRADHLGLSSLDLTAQEDDRQSSRRDSAIPPSLLKKPKETVSRLLGQPEYSSRIRLETLCVDFFTPLDHLVSRKRYCFSETRISSLDCLILGYLSLMYIPPAPQPWLADIMARSFPHLEIYVTHSRVPLLGKPIENDSHPRSPQSLPTLKESAETVGDQIELPWRSSDAEGALSVGSLLIDTVLDSMPVMKHFYKRSAFRTSVQKATATDQTPSTSLLGSFPPPSPTIVLTMGTGVLLGAYALANLLTWQDSLRRTRLDDFGDAGTALAAFADQMEYDGAAAASQIERSETAPVMEVAVEVDGGAVVDRAGT
ncbi:MAG: hypothetical protein M1817_000050 [Caeruleum heppii]|nr:MAG: hypothetical protein M1817_000050 [Caeruleum heppii]